MLAKPAGAGEENESAAMKGGRAPSRDASSDRLRAPARRGNWGGSNARDRASVLTSES